LFFDSKRVGFYPLVYRKAGSLHQPTCHMLLPGCQFDNWTCTKRGSASRLPDFTSCSGVCSRLHVVFSRFRFMFICWREVSVWSLTGADAATSCFLPHLDATLWVGTGGLARICVSNVLADRCRLLELFESRACR
jgi:hypothetical protein